MQTAGRVCSAFARIFRAAMHASPPSFKHETHLHSGPHRMLAAKHTQYLRWWRWAVSTRFAARIAPELRPNCAAHRLMHPERSQWHAPAAMLLRFLRRGPPESPTLDAASSSAAAEAPTDEDGDDTNDALLLALKEQIRDVKRQMKRLETRRGAGAKARKK